MMKIFHFDLNCYIIVKIIFFMIIFGQGELLNFISQYASLPGSHSFGGLLKLG